MYDQFLITVEKYTPEKAVSDQQFAYLHACVFPMLAKAWDVSLAEAELRCKRQWGEQWMIRKELGYRFVLSKTVLTTKQCNQWIENIWEGASNDPENPVIIPPPDQDWRETERKLKEARKHG